MFTRFMLLSPVMDLRKICSFVYKKSSSWNVLTDNNEQYSIFQWTPTQLRMNILESYASYRVVRSITLRRARGWTHEKGSRSLYKCLPGGKLRRYFFLETQINQQLGRAEYRNIQFLLKSPRGRQKPRGISVCFKMEIIQQTENNALNV